MADDTRNIRNYRIDGHPLYSIAEEGCLRLSPNIRYVVYHKSLNVLLSFTQEGQVIVLDIASGTVLHDTRFIASTDPVASNSNANASSASTSPASTCQPETETPTTASKKTGALKCLSVPERGTLVLAFNGLLGVRKDFGRTLLLESILQPPVSNEEDVVRLELPHNEAMMLRECLQTMDLSQSDSELGNHQTQVTNILTKHMKQYLFSVSKGSRMSSNWSIVTLELPLKSLKMVCTHAVLEMRKNNRSIPALPIAAAIVVRLASLHSQDQAADGGGEGGTGALAGSSTSKEDALSPFFNTAAGSNNNFSNPWEPSSCPSLHPMMSEAARRDTFDTWPHMNYKWALPPQMAEAGFYHQPNTPESDRAVCFLCNVCLICWEPSDEPW